MRSEVWTYALGLGLDLLYRLSAGAGCQYGPDRFSRAAARRLKAGLRVAEAYLRRLLMLRALAVEPDLSGFAGEMSYKLSGSGRPKPASVPAQARGYRFRMFPNSRPAPVGLSPRSGPAAPVPAAPILQRVSVLQALYSEPEKRARRLAFFLSRRRPGILPAPGIDRPSIPRRYGTELSGLYDSFCLSIHTASRARPPPLGPLCGKGPRIRRL